MCVAFTNECRGDSADEPGGDDDCPADPRGHPGYTGWPRGTRERVFYERRSDMSEQTTYSNRRDVRIDGTFE